jgi:carboxypeptidase C (cathepsin A)
VQGALGVPVNYTAANVAVNEAFSRTGDFFRPGSLDAIAYLLDSGVKVALMYGDRDFACNWIGGEEVSLAINYSMSNEFRKAGYTPILSTIGIGGQVRQYGNFSFSRVYQAGHEGECTR